VPAEPRPNLQIFPAEDVAFRRYVRAAVESMAAVAVGRQAGRHARRLEPQDLQWRLRERYPAAVVRERDALADPGTDQTLWYVYRFGSVTPGRRWWEEPGHAWAILDDERRFVEVSTSLTEIAEVAAEDLRGRPIEAFSNPDDVSARDDVAALWLVLRERGLLHSTLRFRHRDGTPREIEYHVTRDGAGPGRHLAVVREIDAS
jgi:PAS domain S-box-containing protein